MYSINKGAGDATNRGHAQAKLVPTGSYYVPVLPFVCREVEKAGGHGSQSRCPRAQDQSARASPSRNLQVHGSGHRHHRQAEEDSAVVSSTCPLSPEAPHALRMNSEASLFRGIWQDHTHRGAVHA